MIKLAKIVKLEDEEIAYLERWIRRDRFNPDSLDNEIAKNIQSKFNSAQSY